MIIITAWAWLRGSNVTSRKAPRPVPYCDIDECHTLGDHLRRKRLHSNTSQGCVAQILGLTRGDSLTNWELNHFQPQARFYPFIIEYLGYTPLYNLAGTSLSKRLQQYLFVNGYSQKEVAKQIGIDPTSLSKLIDEQKVLSRTKRSVMKYLQRKE